MVIATGGKFMTDISQFKKNNQIKPPLIGEYIVKNYNNKYHFRLIEDNKEIWRYDEDEGIYRNDAEDIIMNITQCLLAVESKDFYIKEVVKWFKNLRTKKGLVGKDTEYLIDRSKLNPDPKYLCLNNGVFDLNKSKIHKHSYKYKLIKKLPINYKDGAKSGKIDKFIKELFNNQDDRDIIQEMFGYTLWSNYNGNKAFILVGPGSNGKSTLLSVLRKMLGNRNTTAVSLDNITSGHRFMAVELYGKMANISIELGKSALRNTKIFKEATGKDKMMGEKKGKDPIVFENHAKLIFAVNHVPKSNDTSAAFYRRWVPVEFNNTFAGTKADTDLVSKITTNHIMSAWFNWSVEGLNRLRKNNWRFTGGWTAKDVEKWWNYNTSQIFRFIKEKYKIDTQHIIDKKDVYSEYQKYCKNKNQVSMQYNEFCKKIYNESPFDIKEVTKSGQRVWKGIKEK